MFLVTEEDYLSDKVSEKNVLTNVSKRLDRTSYMTKFQPLQKMISCILVTQFQSLSILHAAKYSDKSSKPLECTNVHMVHNNLTIIILTSFMII